jgi:hypothetical protein
MSTQLPILFPVVIASGAALSGAIAIGPYTLVGIQMPAAWVAAGLSFQVSQDGGTTFRELQSTTSPVAITAAAGQFIAIDPATWLGITYLKVRSGTSGSPVNQTNGAAITLVTRPMP